MNLFSNKATPERSLWKQLFAIFWLKSMKNTSQRVPFSKDIGCVNFLLVLSQKGTTYSHKLFSHKNFCFLQQKSMKNAFNESCRFESSQLIKSYKSNHSNLFAKPNALKNLKKILWKICVMEDVSYSVYIFESRNQSPMFLENLFKYTSLK